MKTLRLLLVASAIGTLAACASPAPTLPESPAARLQSALDPAGTDGDSSTTSTGSALTVRSMSTAPTADDPTAVGEPTTERGGGFTIGSD